MLMPKQRPPTSPGTMLEEEFLRPLGISQTELAKRLCVPFQRINRVMNQRQAITPDTAMRLARFFGNGPDYWLYLQLKWDLWHAMQTKNAKVIQTIRPVKYSQAMLA